MNREPERIDEILDELKRLWKLNPEQRLGQLLENYVFFGGQRGDRTSIQLFYQEDNVTLEHLKTNSKVFEDIRQKYLKEHLG